MRSRKFVAPLGEIPKEFQPAEAKKPENGGSEVKMMTEGLIWNCQ